MTAKTIHERAKTQRDRKLANQISLLTACACEYPIRTYRNGHGHGKTIDGLPCPAISIYERLREERQAREDDV